MQNPEPQTRRVHINCGELDMRDASEESVAAIDHVNAGNVLVTPRTRPLMSRFSLNMGSLIEIPDGARLMRKIEVLGREAFVAGPQILANLGTLVIAPEVTIQDLESGLAEIVNRGRLLYPEHLGAIASKVSHNSGHLQPYPSGARLIPGDLSLDEAVLGSLADATILVVAGDLNVPQPLTSEGLSRKLASLQVTGKIQLPAESEADILQRLETAMGMPKMKVFPEGFEMVERQMHWRTASLASWSGRRIYSTEPIYIDADVTPEALDGAVDGVISEAMVVCPAGAATVFAQKADTLRTTVHFYEGALWLVEDEVTLRASRFELLDGAAALFVTGEVEVDPSLDPKILLDRLTGVYNWGTITCTPAQMDALEVRMVVAEGQLEDSTFEEEEVESEGDEEEDDSVTINAGHYRL
jgi:hypothetical protein